MDRAGRVSLHYAALDDDVSAIGNLIRQGSHPDVQDEQGLTPLHFAAQEYSLAAAAALLEAGASVDIEKRSETHRSSRPYSIRRAAVNSSLFCVLGEPTPCISAEAARAHWVRQD